jgi:hypothetical protein
MCLCSVSGSLLDFTGHSKSLLFATLSLSFHKLHQRFSNLVYLCAAQAAASAIAASSSESPTQAWGFCVVTTPRAAADVMLGADPSGLWWNEDG